MLNPQIRLLCLLILAAISFGATPGFAAAPTITSIAPNSGKMYDVITVNGTNFTAPATVSFNGIPSSKVTVSSTTKLTATVPNNAPSGKVTVATGGGSVTSGSTFIVLPGIVSTNSGIGAPGSAQTIYFTGYGASEAIDLYFDNVDFALSVTSSLGVGNITVTIPATAYPGAHWLTVIGRRTGTTVQIPFTVRTDWMQFGFTPAHPSSNPFENVISTTTIADLDEAWETAPIGSMQSTPAVVAGVIYATFGDGSVRAFDEQTGAVKWSYFTGGSTMFSSPAVGGGMVFAGSSDNYFYALDAKTGALKWRYLTGDVIYTSPTLNNGTVYFGSYDKKVYALQASPGTFIWSYTTGGAVYSSPTVAGGNVYVGSFDNKLYALKAATGALVWQAPTTGLILASPVVVGGLVCVGSEDKTMYAFRASSGTLAWSYTTPGLIDSTVGLIGTTLYFGGADGKLYSLTAAGTLRWSVTVPGAGAIRGGVATANGIVYVTDGLYTYAYTPSGSLLTVLPAGSSYGGPIVVNGAVIVGDKTDNVIVRYTTF